MQRLMCKGKIHRAKVTDAELEYEGSVTIDAALMKAADILPHEVVQITNLSNAVRWITYAIPAEEGSGRICLNGPPARLFRPGDFVVILSLGWVDAEELGNFAQRVVFVDGDNRIARVERRPLAGGNGWAAEQAEVIHHGKQTK